MSDVENGYDVLLYRFPLNKRAARATELQQAAKLCEECAEVVTAIADGETPGRVLEELADVIQAAEGLQRRFGTDASVEASLERVYQKCRDRGDYS